MIDGGRPKEADGTVTTSKRKKNCKKKEVESEFIGSSEKEKKERKKEKKNDRKRGVVIDGAIYPNQPKEPIYQNLEEVASFRGDSKGGSCEAYYNVPNSITLLKRTPFSSTPIPSSKPPETKTTENTYANLPDSGRRNSGGRSKHDQDSANKFVKKPTSTQSRQRFQKQIKTFKDGQESSKKATQHEADMSHKPSDSSQQHTTPQQAAKESLPAKRQRHKFKREESAKRTTSKDKKSSNTRLPRASIGDDLVDTESLLEQVNEALKYSLAK